MAYKYQGPITAEGYAKQRGIDSESHQMMVEAQAQDYLGEPRVYVRIRVRPKAKDRPLQDLQENSITLSTVQARRFANSVLAQADRAERMLPKKS